MFLFRLLGKISFSCISLSHDLCLISEKYLFLEIMEHKVVFLSWLQVYLVYTKSELNSKFTFKVLSLL